MSEDEAPAVPLLRVVRGDPTPEELAALVSVLMTRRPAAAPEASSVSAWAGYWRTRRRPTRPGPQRWRDSLR